MTKQKILSKSIYFFVSLFFFGLVNFYFSNLILANLPLENENTNSLINLVYVKNTGAAFSILEESTNLLIYFSFFAILFILIYIFKNIKDLNMKELFFSAILIAGISGNLFERIHFGFVRDFFELTFINFPVFNISDIFINIGVFGIIILLLLSKKPVKF